MCRPSCRLIFFLVLLRASLGSLVAIFPLPIAVTRYISQLVATPGFFFSPHASFAMGRSLILSSEFFWKQAFIRCKLPSSGPPQELAHSNIYNSTSSLLAFGWCDVALVLSDCSRHGSGRFRAKVAWTIYDFTRVKESTDDRNFVACCLGETKLPLWFDCVYLVRHRYSKSKYVSLPNSVKISREIRCISDNANHITENADLHGFLHICHYSVKTRETMLEEHCPLSPKKSKRTSACIPLRWAPRFASHTSHSSMARNQHQNQLHLRVK